MRRPVTFIICGLALAAVIFLAVYEPLTRGTRDREIAAQQGTVLRLDPARVNEVRIYAGESELVLRRREKGWQLGAKSKDRADPALIDRLLHTAAALRYHDRIDGREFKKEEDLSPYGLRNPKRRIEFDEGAKTIALFLGKDAASEKRMYARTSASRDVYLIGDEFLELAFRDPGMLRDRRLTDLAPEQIDRLVIRREGGEIDLVHEANGWRIVKPLSAPAEEAKVVEYLKSLLGQKILEFASEDTGDLSGFGIREGYDEISLFADGNEKPQTLRFGKDSSGTLFGQFTARDSVYRLQGEAAGLLKVTPETFRDRRLLVLNLDVVDQIRVRMPKRQFLLKRSAEGWELVEGAEVRPASAVAVQNLADAVSTAVVSNYHPISVGKLEQFGFVPPRCQIHFVSVLSENTPETRAGEQIIASIAFGGNSGGQIFARLGDAPEILAVPDSVMNAIPEDPAAWVAPGRP